MNHKVAKLCEEWVEVKLLLHKTRQPIYALAKIRIAILPYPYA